MRKVIENIVDRINSWEHRRSHSIGMEEYPTEDEIREYYQNIPPVIVRSTGDGDYALIGEGNHRVNTCKDLELPIPAYIIKGEK